MDGMATVTPTSGVGPFTYSWSTVPAQTTSTATNLPIGTYTATINDSKGCSNTATTTITQPPPLTMAIGGTTNPTTCGGADGTITLTGLVTDSTFMVSYLFTATGTVITNTVTVSIVAVAPGNVVITGLRQGSYDSIRIIPTGCPYNTLGPIVLADPPPPALPYVTSNSPVCVNQTLNLTTTSVTPGVTYSWAGPFGFTSVSQTPSKTAAFSDSGWYVVTVTVNNCSSKDSTRVVIRDTPVPALTNNSPVCSGTDTIRLTSASNIGADFYVWNGPDGFMSNFQNPIVIRPAATASGIYTVVITYQSCTGMGTTTVTVNQTPDPPVVSDTNYCQNTYGPTFLAPALTAVGTNLQWYNAAGMPIPAAPQPMTNVVGHTTWYVDQTSNDTPACKSERAAINVGIYALPDPKFTISDSVFCQGTYFTFEARDVNTGVDYQGLTWTFTPASSGIPDVVNDVNPVIHSFGIADVVDVSVAVNYYVCPDTVISRSVLVFPYPGLYLGPDKSICPGSQELVIGDSLNRSNPAASWVWSTGETTPLIKVVAPGTYYVKAKINGCSTSDTIIVANDCYMNLPNVFTPNGDGVNDYFYPRQYLTRGLTSFNMSIYNRWGQVVFTTTSIEGRGWDGKFNDVPQPQGVFVYVIDATFKDGQKEHHQGNVTLMR
jgi:gliding motility-associated-like protein